MDEKESRKAEVEARRATSEKTTYGPHPIERYLAALAYGGRQSGTTEKTAPERDGDHAEEE